PLSRIPRVRGRSDAWGHSVFSAKVGSTGGSLPQSARRSGGSRGGRSVNAQGWHRLVAEIEQLDITAGRALREALAVHDAPLLVRVSGRAGTGREGVESAVRTLARDVRVVGAVTDAPGERRSEPADIVVRVVPRRLDPGEAHPADL